MVELYDDSSMEYHTIDLKAVKRIIRKEGNTLTTFALKFYFYDGEILEMVLDTAGVAALSAAAANL